MAEPIVLRRAPAAVRPLLERGGLCIAEESPLALHSLRLSRRHEGGAATLLQALALNAPSAPNTYSGNEALSCAWIEPRAWLLLGAGETQLAGFAVPQNCLLTEVSQRSRVLRVAGAEARALLTAATSAALTLAPGRCARGRFAEETEVFMQQLGEADYRLLFDSALGRYAADWLCDAAGLIQEQKKRLTASL